MPESTSCAPALAGAVEHHRRARLTSSAAAAALAVLVAACTGRPSPRAPVPVRLSEPDIRAVASILRLEDRRQLDTAVLATLARASAPEVRRRAFIAVGRIGDLAGRVLARPGLHDADPGARAAAAFALGMLRDTALVDSLGALAMTGPAVAAEQAAFALGRIGGPAAREQLERILGGSAPSPVAGRALLAIWRTPRRTESVAAVRRFLSSPDTALRWRAAYALMRMGDPAAAPDLLRAMHDSDPEIRAQAARGLRAAVVDSAGQRTAAQAALLAGLRDAGAHVRINAALALAGYRAPELVSPIAAQLHDPDRNVGIAAAQALGTLRQGEAAPPLQELVDSAGAPLALRAAALAALVRVAPAAGIPAAAAWASPGRGWRERFYAASALDGVPWASAATLYSSLVKDTDSRVVANALTSLQDAAGDSTAPRPALVEALGARDPIVRAMAIGILGARSDPADLQLFLDSYGRAVGDTLDDAAVAAVDALGNLQKHGAPAGRGFFARFPRSTDFVVRLHAARELGDGWGPATPVETGRTDAFYMDVVRRLVLPALAGGPAPRARIQTFATAVRDGTGPTPAPSTGAVILELTGGDTPLTVDNFLTLARLHYFDHSRWHRVVPNFVAQDGDPRGDGSGGPGWAIRDELSSASYGRGAFGMALSGPDTGGSQFFITLSPQPHLDAGYTLFGSVVEGMDVVDRILQDDEIRSVDVIP